MPKHAVTFVGELRATRPVAGKLVSMTARLSTAAI
jgi:hypothetical protein